MTKEDTQACIRQPVVNIKNLDCKELSRKGKLERTARVDGGQLGSKKLLISFFDIEMVIEGNLEQGN